VTSRVVIATIRGGEFLPAAGDGTVVPWWSFTKTILAATALRLVQDGALTLDGRLDGAPYSVRQLLQHTAGFGDYGGSEAYHAAVARGDEPWPVAELLRRCDGDALQYRPGEGWRYSNIGYLKIRELIERVTGAPIEVALAEAVFGRLGVPDARLAKTPADLDGVVMGEAARYDPGWVYHGLVAGALRDAARLLDRLMDGALIEPALVAEMRRSCLVGKAIQGRPFGAPGYGLGLMTDMASAEGCAGHTGSGPGTVIAVYHRKADCGPIVIAAFAKSDDPADVEQIAMGTTLSPRSPCPCK
jgi:CubicO group peptidase (beta-lactamase class C family)